MRIGITLASLALSTLLSACVSPSGQTGSATQAGLVRPGEAMADPMVAVTLFKNVCVETRPRFERGRANLSKASFAKRDPKSDIFYDQRFDLSFKIGSWGKGTGQGCSMIFASREKPRQLALMFGAVVAGETSRKPTVNVTSDIEATQVDLPHGQQFVFAPAGRTNGRNYYRAFIFADS